MQEHFLPLQKISDLQGNLAAIQKARDAYKFQKKLTQKLESHEGDFTEITLLEIALWKLNRYPDVSGSLLQDLNDFRKDYSEEKMKALLRIMLDPERAGFGLPMASTFLRFASPQNCAIIDQRAYRYLTGKPLEIPRDIEAQLKLYFEYLEDLKKGIEGSGIRFEEADQVLYQLDKEYNKEHKLNNYGTK